MREAFVWNLNGGNFHRGTASFLKLIAIERSRYHTGDICAVPR